MIGNGDLKLPILAPSNCSANEDWDTLPQIVQSGPRRWDFGGWGDLRTWAILFAMFFFGIALAGAAYLLPHGRDASVPAIHVY